MRSCATADEHKARTLFMKMALIERVGVGAVVVTRGTREGVRGVERG